MCLNASCTKHTHFTQLSFYPHIHELLLAKDELSLAPAQTTRLRCKRESCFPPYTQQVFQWDFQSLGAQLDTDHFNIPVFMFQRSQTQPELPHPELTPSNTHSETTLIYSTRGSPLSISAHPHTDRVSQHCTNFRRAASAMCHLLVARGESHSTIPAPCRAQPWQALRADPPSSRAAGCLHSSGFCHYIMKSWHYRQVISWRSLSNSRKTVCPHLTSTVSKLGVGKVLITHTQHGYFML